jgi:hypothetical protein
MSDENGTQTIEGMEAEGAVPGAMLIGTEEQLSFDLGSQYGLKESSVKLLAPSAFAVEGQYQEGDRIQIVLDVEIEYIAFPPLRDRGFRVGTERRHFATVLAASQVTD